MDGGGSLNLLYQDTVHKMGIDPSRIKPTKMTFKGVIPGVEAHCIGSITLEVVFGSPDNFRSEELIFDIVPFRGVYHALLGRTTFARLLQSMETQSALSEERSTPRPSQQKRKAISQGNQPVRRFKARTPSSALRAISK